MSEFKGKDAQKNLERALAEAVVSASKKAMLARIEEADPFAAEREEAVRAEAQARAKEQAERDPRKAELDEIVEDTAERFNALHRERLHAMHAEPFEWKDYSESYEIDFGDDGSLSIAAVFYVPEGEKPECYVLVKWQDREDRERRECHHGTLSQDDLLAFLTDGLMRIEAQG